MLFCKNCNKWVKKADCAQIDDFGKDAGLNYYAELYNHTCGGTIADKVYNEPKTIAESMAAQADLCDDMINFKR